MKVAKKQKSGESETKYTQEEIANSKRIYKSATPKYTIDWYIKWVSSILLLVAMCIRSAQFNAVLDLGLSFIGMLGWLWVGILWKDRAIIIVNGAASVILLTGILRYLKHFTY
tara:strand:- start:685 stop:1023 length:339 start_codon:yes stop_codon:yes gene_type:complete